MEPRGNGNWSLHADNDPDWAQGHGGKVSRFGAEKRRQGVTEKVWKGRGSRRGEDGVRRKEQGGRRREGEKRTVVGRGARGTEARFWI